VVWGERRPGPPWDGRVDGLAYVCRRFVCAAPAATTSELDARLDAALAATGPPSAS